MRPPRWTAARSVLIRTAACLAVTASLASCGSDAPPEIDLLTTATWNDNPPSLDKIGYQVSVDFGWPSRHDSCFSMPPDLTVTMNERQVTPTQLGECVWDMLVTFDAVAPGPVHVRVASGSHVYGEADFANLFPGAGAQLAVPGDGTVQAGSQFTVTVPPTVIPAASDNFGFGQLYWIDVPPPEVPYYTEVLAVNGMDPQTIVITAPATTTGRATLIVKSVLDGQDFSIGSSCTGFRSCATQPASQAAGPIDVQIVP